MAEFDSIRQQQGFETVKAPQLPISQQQVAEQAFESAVTPLRESFQKGLETTTESLAQRGIQFGGLGGQRLSDIFQKQQSIEGQIAGQLGAQIGASALDQAFAASEAAKNRQLQKELQTAGFAENQVGREFSAEQAGLGREFTGEQASLGRQLQRELTEKGFEFQAGEAETGREFAAEQAGLSREQQLELQTQQQNFQAQQAGLGREFTSEEAQRARDFGMSTIEAQQAFQAEQADLGRTFTGVEATRQREYGLTTQEAAQQFAAEEALLGRTFSAQEAALQRDFQQSLVDSNLAASKDEAALAREERQFANIQNLAISGNLDKDTAQQLLEEYYGQPLELSTNDELTLQRMSVASGLSTDDYLKMRQAIGEGQLLDVLENPEDYIDSPEAQRQFQAKLVQQQIDLQTRLAQINAGAQVNVAQQQADSAMDIEKERRILPSCVISTAAYKAGYLTKYEMMDFVRYRLNYQSNMINADKIWSGYILAFHNNANKIAKLGRNWHKHIAYKLGKSKYSLIGHVIHIGLSVISKLTYLLNKKRCENIASGYKGVNLIRMYKNIIKEVEGGKKNA